MKSNIGRRRKSLLNKTNSSGRSGLGSHDTSKGSYVGQGDIAIGAGRMGTLNPVNSLGRDYKGDKGRVKATYDAQVKADRKAAALDRRGWSPISGRCISGLLYSPEHDSKLFIFHTH